MGIRGKDLVCGLVGSLPKYTGFLGVYEMKNTIFAICLFAISGCQLDVTPTFYIRDMQDVIDGDSPIELPLFMSVPTSSIDECQSEISQVLGILNTFGMQGDLQSCVQDEGGFFAKANVEFKTSVALLHENSNQSADGLISMFLEPVGDGNFMVYIVKNDKLDLAMSAIENALVFASLDAASVDFKITISNDTRNKVLFKTVDSFVDGVPYDLNEFDLAPRAEINILSSDVAVGLFFKRGWYKLGEFYYLDGT